MTIVVDFGSRDGSRKILVDAFIAHAWAVRRWRRIEAGLLQAGSAAGMKRALIPLVGVKEPDSGTGEGRGGQSVES